jgi:RNA polymerase sigma factor (sigma-70 family)
LVERFGSKHFHDVEDAISDSFARLLEGLLGGRLRITAKGAFGYLLTAARRRYVEIRYDRKRYVPLEAAPEEALPATPRTPLDEAIDRDLKRKILRWIKKRLPPQQARVALMKLNGVRNYRKIAAKLGITFEAVKVTAARGMKTLRRHKKEVKELVS